MKKKFILKLMQESLEDRKQIRRKLEENVTFQRYVPYQVKEVFYKLYDASFEANYELIVHIQKCKYEQYDTNNIVYEKFQDVDEQFLNFCFDLSEWYRIKSNIL